MEEHPIQYLIRCNNPSVLAARVFAEDSIVEARLHDDRQGLYVKTRNIETFSLLLNRVVIEESLQVESVTPVDDDLNAVYHYLIGASGGGQA